MALLTFLSLNGKWVDINPGILYRIALSVSKSESKEKSIFLKKIEIMIKKYITDSL